jgi:hypothetical protein
VPRRDVAMWRKAGWSRDKRTFLQKDFSKRSIRWSTNDDYYRPLLFFFFLSFSILGKFNISQPL